MFLLDTNVVSLTSPLTKSERAEGKAWLKEVGNRSFISVITVTEIQFGASLLRAGGAPAKAAALQDWVEITLSDFRDRVLPFDIPIARRSGELYAHAKAAGKNPGFQDACIAATAELNGFTVVTYNLKHFEALGVAHHLPGQRGKA